MNVLFSTELVSISDATQRERFAPINTGFQRISENNDLGKTRLGEAEAGENDELVAEGDFLGVGAERRYAHAVLDGDTTRRGTAQPSRTARHCLSQRIELPSFVR
jgi:hypothetical protein